MPTATLVNEQTIPPTPSSQYLATYSLRKSPPVAVPPQVAPLLLPCPPSPPTPYPTALIPPQPAQYEAWKDPRYSLPPLPGPSGHDPATLNAANMYYTSTPPPQSRRGRALLQQQQQQQQQYQQSQLNPYERSAAFGNASASAYNVEPVAVPAFNPMNFSIPALKRAGGNINRDSPFHSPPPPRRSVALPARFLARFNPPRENVYEAVYSGVPVYELDGPGVMRRKKDSWINATHILKAAGLDKSTRTRVLERDVHRGEHDKVQGGYGKYQGTWVPLYRARELAHEYRLEEALNDILDIPE
ncbi:hypothetical protein HDU87_001816 [Geranomyces variabilis]|uniref:HTH APSES-type domain-containing protein n=1 Tax=Geranomyces variabilis TaxID=109894 RepID=A0AAD5TMZ6_9FUNG|nr:hypothetical protein HDU87_001816 [Geranomyces variabilis]